MTPADLARLEIAKRAYRATEPSAAEVQKGVRRARLALRRPKERRRWLGKGLVMVVLAVGGLAYAKPHALGGLLSQLQGEVAPSKAMAARSGTSRTPPPPVEPAAAIARPTQVPALLEAQPPAALPERELSVRSSTPKASEAKPADAAAPREATKPVEAATASDTARAPGPASHAKAVGETAGIQPDAPAPGGTTSSVSEWGRVGQALARGDEAQALAVLGDLSQSADQRTRDKADLGRAQLFMASGEQERACRIARALTQRGAGGSIDRQAQALLKSCAR